MPEKAEVSRRQASIAHGAGLMVAMRGVSRVIGIFSTAILARLLTPDDFGIVVLGTSVLNVVQLLSDLSLGAALVRMHNPTRAQFDTAWTIGLLRGAVVGGIVLASASAVATSMHESRVVPILWTLAVATMVQSAENIRMVEFQIDLRFAPVFRYQFLSRIASFATTLALALILRSYWALILSSLVTSIVTTAYSYVLRPYLPRLTLASWRDLFNFSKWAALGSLLAVIDVYSINFLMGWLGGTRAMGLFQISSQIAALPASEIAAPIRAPLYAGFARLRNDRSALARAFIEGFGFLFLVITPMSLGIFVTAPLIAPLALGPHWADATAMIDAIVFYALFDAFAHYTHNLFVVLNRQPTLIVLSIIFLAVRVPAAICGGYADGAIGAVYGMAATAIVGAFYWFALSLTLIGVPAIALWRVLWRTVAACAAMMAVLLPMRQLWPVGTDYVVLGEQLLVSVFVGASVHIGFQMVLWQTCGRPKGAESRALEVAFDLWKRMDGHIYRRRRSWITRA